MAEAPAHGNRKLDWVTFQLVCEQIAENGQPRKSCEAVGFSYQTVRGAISEATARDDHEWSELWADAQAAYAERIEAEIHRRAIEGIEKDVYGRVGKDEDGVIGTEIQFSDSLLALQAKANIPKYQNRQLINAAGGLEVPDVFSQLSPRARKLVRDIIVADLADQHASASAAQLAGEQVALEDKRGNA